jgi:hypothetical protein
VEAATNGEVSWNPEEVIRMRREMENIAPGGPIAPADKSAVPCPHCDRRAFKYLRSLEKHVWNDHGVGLSRDELDSFEQQLRAGAASGGGAAGSTAAFATPAGAGAGAGAGGGGGQQTTLSAVGFKRKVGMYTLHPVAL